MLISEDRPEDALDGAVLGLALLVLVFLAVCEWTSGSPFGEGINLLPHLRITQYLIRFVDLLKPDLGLLSVFLPLVTVQIRMVLFGQIKECFPDVLLGHIFLHSEHFVIVYGSVYLKGLLREMPQHD